MERISTRQNFCGRVLVAAAIIGAVPATALANAQIVIFNNDGPGEGFNDPTPATPAGGNPGTTVGAQRLNAFQYAADRWGAILDSSVPITIRANFDPLNCTATSATLGSAGTIGLFRDFEGAPVAGTWFNAALANKLAGEDLDPTSPEINARFNSLLNGDPACLGGGTWYYGFDHNEGPNQTDLMPVLMHEFGHGLGFQSFVSKSGSTIGQLPDGFPDHYLIYLFDNQTNKFWRNMTDAERVISMKNGRHVVWNGPNLLAASGFLSPGTAGMRVTSPAAVAGKYLVGEAAFGPRLTATPLAGDFLYTTDTTNSPLGCSPYAAGTFTGRIALIDRGTCNFTVKVKNAQDAGAVAVVIADNVAGTPPGGLPGVDATVTAPAVRITLGDGSAIKAQLALGTAVSISLALDLTVRAGADEANRPLLYTPDPVAPGSNVSHFDTSTTPNTLMEPAINSDLTTDVDLALPLLRDVGWYPDADIDLVPDGEDNCVAVANQDQADTDGDLVGDACDDDDDNDGAADVNDNCRLVVNPGQENTDADALGNACDPDDDNDGALDAADNCPLVANAGQADRNTDGAGDACDDEDADGLADAADNCPDAANAGQADADGDTLGDACDPDDDNDAVLDAADNCPLVGNAGQADTDTDGFGDACDGDLDGDAVANAADNCPGVANGGQQDLDGDGAGDACDLDDDNDGAPDATDNCPVIANAGQANTDADTLGDACDPDDDNDAVLDAADNCPVNANAGQANADGDALGDACDDDDDNDGDLDAADNCPLVGNASQLDTDGDGMGNACDIDDDADGVLDTADNCALVKNIGQVDTDLDGKGNECDDDDDGDARLDGADNCPLDANADQADADGDGIGDACDPDFGQDEGDGGCCSSRKGSVPPAGTLLFGLAVLAIVRRRRR